METKVYYGIVLDFKKRKNKKRITEKCVKKTVWRCLCKVQRYI